MRKKILVSLGVAVSFGGLVVYSPTAATVAFVFVAANSASIFLYFYGD
ncbi:hypothetical protein KC644_01835 [Candidatus Berkelbacteria bacterium]|nr:hypothetical protein [Candidatus Berkelbacteria bacterium]